MIHLICALRCEAQPLIDHFAMRAVGPNMLFDCYTDRNHDISLTVSGPGKTAAASAVIHTHMLLDTDNDDSWINIGIAGHGGLDVGTLVVAHKVSDYATGRTWYPQFVFATQLCPVDLITLDSPGVSYHDTAMFDMEAAGYYDAVSRINTLERCHSLKIISDNRDNTIHTINKNQVQGLFHGNIGQIHEFANRLVSIKTSPVPVRDDDPEYRQLLEQYHFTRTQGISLKKLMQRWRVLSPETTIDIKSCGTPGNSREVLACIKERLDSLAFRF